jgi:uncharacterized membrane protein YkvA (DUF1232 family)
MNQSAEKPGWLIGSWAYRKARALVDATINSPERLMGLATKAGSFATNHTDGLSRVIDSLKTSLRLMSHYAAGEYRDISAKSLGLLVASIIYLIMPMDMMPDFIIGLGLTDDAALLAWTLRSIMDDLERFSIWEANQEVHSTNP